MMGPDEYCCICVKSVGDGLGHYLNEHPGCPVPHSIVLNWARNDEDRCPECFYAYRDMEFHRQLVHVLSVTLQFDRWDYKETVHRNINGLFECPWCSASFCFAEPFEVRSKLDPVPISSVYCRNTPKHAPRITLKGKNNNDQNNNRNNGEPYAPGELDD